MAEHPPTTIDLLRHGECHGGSIFRGTTNSPLSTKGWQQMTDTLAGQGGWQRVVTSPLSRCREFAEALANQNQLPLSVVADLREIDFGVWEGREVAEVWRQDALTAHAYYARPGSVTPAGGEHLERARRRVLAAWQQLLSRFRGQHLLAVTHGGTIRLLLNALAGAPLSQCQFFAVPHASLSRVVVYSIEGQDRVQLQSHLPGATQC